MDWKTIVAVAISVVIIIAGMLLQNVFWPKPQTASAVKTEEPAPAATGEAAGGAAAAQPAATGPPPGTTSAAAGDATTTQAAAAAPASVAPGRVVPAPGSEVAPTSQPAQIVRETGVFEITFLTDGATISSLKLKDHRNADGSLVDLVLDPTGPERFFTVAFGEGASAPVTGPFVLREYPSGGRSLFEFSKAMLTPSGTPFTLKKTYVLAEDEYLIELRVSIESGTNEVPAVDGGGIAYTLAVGPQIGPAFKKLDGRNDLRTFVYWWLNGKGKWERKEVRANGTTQTLDQRITWAGIVGKYFTVIGMPAADQGKLVFDSKRSAAGTDRASMSFTRPALKAARTEDVWRFYLGPLKREILARYNDPAKNAFGLKDLKADEVITSPILIGWLANILRWLLELFYSIIPNYGVAIILLTLFTKLVFLPMTFRSSESMARMAALNPKITEIRARLKDKPELMNQEMAELYRREKVNPLGGCLPLLLQLPIFFALYNVLNSHFELRGALFIPGWIPDLSVAESVYDLPTEINLLITRISAVRLLPFIMLATQLLSSKVMQPASSDASGNQMKLLNYAMPIVFLFILYDMPSGLTLYWTVQNILSMVQQLFINYWNRRKKTAAAIAAAAAAPPANRGTRRGRVGGER